MKRMVCLLLPPPTSKKVFHVTVSQNLYYPYYNKTFNSSNIRLLIDLSTISFKLISNLIKNIILVILTVRVRDSINGLVFHRWLKEGCDLMNQEKFSVERKFNECIVVTTDVYIITTASA